MPQGFCFKKSIFTQACQTTLENFVVDRKNVALLIYQIYLSSEELLWEYFWARFKQIAVKAISLLRMHFCAQSVACSSL